MESIVDKHTCPGAERRHVTASLSLSLLVGIAGCGGGGGGDGPDGGGGGNGGGGEDATCDQPIAELEGGFDPHMTLGAADGPDVYVYSGDGFFRVAASGGEPELVASYRQPWQMVVDETHIYWSIPLGADASEIGRVPKVGGATEVLLTDDEMHLDIVAVVDGSVVFVRTDLEGPALLQVRDVEGNVTDLADVTGGPYGYPGIAVHEGHAYFGRDLGDESGIARIALAGGTPEWVAMDPEDPTFEGKILSGETEFAATPGGLFVTSRNNICAEHGKVSRVDWTSGEVQVLATEQPCPLGVRANATHVVWGLTPDVGQPVVAAWSIVAAPVGGGEPETVAVGASDGTPRVSLVDLADGLVFYASGYDLCRSDL